MLTALRKSQVPTGMAQLAGLLEGFGSPEPGNLSRTEDHSLGTLWSPAGKALAHESDTPGPQSALARLGRFLLDHRGRNTPTLGVTEANILVGVANRVRFGPGESPDQPTLGMAAIAAALEPDRLRDVRPGNLVRWFVVHVVGRHGLEHLLPSALVREICATRRTQLPPAARWLWDSMPSLRQRWPNGWPGRDAATGWMLGPECHALDYLRPMLAETEPVQTVAAPAQVERRTQGLANGEAVDFTATGNSGDYCVSGSWYDAESKRRWGRAPSAMLTFCPMVPAGSRMLLAVEFGRGRREQLTQEFHLTITAAARMVFRDRWDGLVANRLMLNLGIAASPGSVLPVAFQLWPPVRPAPRARSDGRALGVPLALLRLIAW
jgi:hypothetical protein